jgi:dihydropteroate synthase
MQDAPHFDDVLGEVTGELAASVARAEAAGVAPAQIVVDPGIGFGKRPQDNLALLANAGWLGERLGKPVLVGPSRKAFLGLLTGDPAGERESRPRPPAQSPSARANAIRVHDGGWPGGAAAPGGTLDRDAVEPAARSGRRLRSVRHDQCRAVARRLLGC